VSETSLYHILGVERSAKADQIRSAYRELVKKYHPDLFSTEADKAQATEKLRLVNEAYAVLGNAERRQRYDRNFAPKPPLRRRPRAADSRRKTGRAHRRRPDPPWRKITLQELRSWFPKKRIGYFSAAAVMCLLLFLAVRSVPSTAINWLLLERLEFSPPKAAAPPAVDGVNWTRLGEFASVSECAAALKEQVRRDEREGSRAVYDEKNGTMAITVHLKKAALPEEAAADKESSQPPGVTRRVRNLECRAIQVKKMESWLGRTLRGGQ
jgi:curved DNA-binding protein CbpA